MRCDSVKTDCIAPDHVGFCEGALAAAEIDANTGSRAFEQNLSTELV
jgi:hypothetical protein